MLHSRHIVVVDFPDGKTETVYQGADITAAEKAKDKAIREGSAEAVIVFHHPTPGQVRYPIREAQEAKERAQLAESAAAGQTAENRLLAAKHRAEANALLAKADALDGKAPAPQPVAESPAVPQAPQLPKPPKPTKPPKSGKTAAR